MIFNKRITIEKLKGNMGMNEFSIKIELKLSKAGVTKNRKAFIFS